MTQRTSSAPGRRVNLIVHVALFVAALLLYTLTLNPDVQPADSGEFQVAAILLGIPHPPGYPLYTMLGWLFAQLPWGSPFARVSFLSVIASAVSLVLVSLATQRLVRTQKWGDEVSSAGLDRGLVALGVGCAGCTGAWHVYDLLGTGHHHEHPQPDGVLYGTHALRRGTPFGSAQRHTGCSARAFRTGVGPGGRASCFTRLCGRRAGAIRVDTNRASAAGLAQLFVGGAGVAAHASGLALSAFARCRRSAFCAGQPE